MIPSVFISSTITDLHYVREAARKVVVDFAMNPVMSDFGEISYMGGRSAESSCYLSVRDCKLMILIIGRRYGSLSKTNPDVSVTESEFDTAQEHKPYLVTLVERDVLSFKIVHDSNPEAEVKFPGMDAPCKTFAFIDKVNAAKQDNGIFCFSNADDVDRILRLQFAGLFGRLLDDAHRSERESLKDILSEIQGIKSVISSGADNRLSIDEIARGARFLLEERNAQFAKLFNTIGQIEELIPLVKKAVDLEGFLHLRHVTVERVASLRDGDGREMMRYRKYEMSRDPDEEVPVFRPHERRPFLEIGWTTATNVVMNDVAYVHFSSRFSELKDRVCGAMSEPA